MKTSFFFITILLNALSTGFFFAWSVSVILGTKKVGNYNYLETMQHINKEILNPIFFIVFFGSLISLIFNSYLQFSNKTVFWFVLAATLVYLVGVFSITAFGNVPLNNELDLLKLDKLNEFELNKFRSYYENSWNQYHKIRTISSLISFVLLLISAFIHKTF